MHEEQTERPGRPTPGGIHTRVRYCICIGAVRRARMPLFPTGTYCLRSAIARYHQTVSRIEEGARLAEAAVRTGRGPEAERIFFSQMVRVSLRRPAQAAFFARAVIWQSKAARQKGFHVPPIAIFSITNRCW